MNLENYTPKGQLEGFPIEVITKMLEYQVLQGYKKDISIFERSACAGTVFDHGFQWYNTSEGYDFWNSVISKQNFDLFFERYPKKNINMQEFKEKDNVIDIITGKKGVVKITGYSPYPVTVNGESYTLEGKSIISDTYPKLLHYCDDYDYSKIDFNNLPQRQEPKRWRANYGDKFYYIDALLSVNFLFERKRCVDNDLYELGNYFQTEGEAKEKAVKLKELLYDRTGDN